MERVIINRKHFSNLSTIGNLILEGENFCNTLELSCRRGDEKGKLAIPEGKYLLQKTFSPRFKKDMWEVTNVPGRSGIRIHSANYASELDGCIAPGVYSPNIPEFIGMSRVTLDRLNQRLEAMNGEIWLSITGGGPVESRI
jgi:hypothetical protein